MPNTPTADEKCTMEHTPCRKAYRYQVYDNARRCKRVTIKRCKEDPTKKKMCETSKKGISRLTKKRMCSYIVSNPAFRSEGQLFQKDFKNASTLKKELTQTLQREFFTPIAINWSQEHEGTIGDTHRALYLAKYSGGKTLVYTQKYEPKALWMNYDENEDIPLDDWKLQFPSDFESTLRSARRKGIHNIFLNMRLYKKFANDPDVSKHANFLLLDIKNNLLYRYEPSGYGLYDVFDMDNLDDQLTAWARKRGLKYIPPWDSCPSQLFAKVAALQRMAGKAQKEEGDPGGFCKVWSTFMLEQKLRHPEMDMNDLQKHLLHIFKENNIDLTYFARTYIRRVQQYSEQILKAHGMKNQDPDEYFEKHWVALMKKATR